MKNTLLAVILLLAITLSFVWPHLPIAQRPKLLETLPTQTWGLESKNLEPTETELRWLDGAEFIKRIYTYQGKRWILSATDGSTNRQAVHDPAYCFVGGGWSVKDKQKVALAGGHATLLTLQKSSREKYALYWFSDGGSPFDSLPEYWARTTLRRLTRGLSGPEPILFLLQGNRPVGGKFLYDANRFVTILNQR